MILLDTDHINVLQSAGSQTDALKSRMDASPDQDFAVTVVTIEEQMRGWLAFIHRASDVHMQISAYTRLIGLFDFFARWRLQRWGGRPVQEITTGEGSDWHHGPEDRGNGLGEPSPSLVGKPA